LTGATSLPDVVHVAVHRRIRNRALAIALSVVPFGLSFGAVSVASGLSPAQTCLLSTVLFSGASQFALVSIIGAGGGVVSALATALLLAVRNGLYGTRVATLLQPRGWRRAVAAQVTIDESTAMALTEVDSGHSARAFWTTAACVFGLWNASTLIGALVGDHLGSPAAAGLDAAGPAAFTALLAPRLRAPEMRGVALAAVAVALATVPLLPVGSSVLVGGAVAAIGMALKARA
jgi:predicted branched-subunit amino acid permease